MGVDLGRLLDRAEETLNACRVADGNPGLALGLALGASWQEGRDKVIIRPNPRRIRSVGRAAPCRIHRKRRPWPRTGAGRVARRPRPPGPRGRARRPLRPRLRVLPLGVRDRGRGRDPRDQPVRPARTSRRRRTGPTRSSPAGAGGLSPGQSRKGRSRSCSRRRGPATTSRSRRSSTRPRKSGSAVRRARPRSDRLRGHVRPRPALPALDRPAAQGRRADRLLPPGRRRHGRRARRSPGRSSASAGSSARRLRETMRR